MPMGLSLSVHFNLPAQLDRGVSEVDSSQPYEGDGC